MRYASILLAALLAGCDGSSAREAEAMRKLVVDCPGDAVVRIDIKPGLFGNGRGLFECRWKPDADDSNYLRD